jgi:hypothetical protein
MRATAATFAIAGLVVFTGCSSGPEDEPTSAPAPAPTRPSAAEPPTASPGAVEISPNGVTTAVGAAAESTEEEYYQACHAAKVWMQQRGGDPKSQIAPYLATLQSASATPGPGTFETPWSQLSPGRQAAVIVAVRAAADALCG